MDREEHEREFRACARYDELPEMKSLKENHPDLDVDCKCQFSGSTALHMACANGHTNIVEYLLSQDAKILGNIDGNTPLHWAVLNKQSTVVRQLFEHFSDLNVLTTNSKGKSAMSIAYDVGDLKVLQMLLEHPSARELDKMFSKKKGKDGKNGDNAGGEEEEEQTLVHAFCFDPKYYVHCRADSKDDIFVSSQPATTIAGEQVAETETSSSQLNLRYPVVLARELANEKQAAPSTDTDLDALGLDTKAKGTDWTGLYIWSASIVLSRWIVDKQDMFQGRRVCELGAGCGVPALTAMMYTTCSKVVITDLHQRVVDNITFNIDKCQKRKSERDAWILAQAQNDEPAQTEDVQEGQNSSGITEGVNEEKKTKKKKKKKKKKSKRATACVVDWKDTKTYPAQNSADVILGADIVYHSAIVPHLVRVIDHVLSPNGTLLFATKNDERQGVAKFIKAMKDKGFHKHSMEIAPQAYHDNPLPGVSAMVQDLHFSELSSASFQLHSFSRR